MMDVLEGMLGCQSNKLVVQSPALSTPSVRLVLLGLGALKCRFPGMVRCSNVRQTLMSAAQQHKHHQELGSH